MSQGSKEWIKQRMATLKKQAGFAFNHDLFISVLLCLVSDRDKHLVLTAPSDRIPEVAQMATQICRGLFGFTTANVACQADLGVTDLVQALFASNRDDADGDYRQYPDSPPKAGGRAPDSGHGHHRHTRSAQTFGSQHSVGSFLARSAYSKSTEEDESSVLPSLQPIPVSPVNPMDFTLRKRDRSHFLPPRNSAFLPVKESPHSSMVVRQDRTRWSEHEELKRPVSSVTHRLAQTVVIQRLSDANEAIMAALTELVIAKELRISNVRYNTPKPYFLVILVLPHDFNRRAISAQLLDRFFVGYRFDEDMFQYPANAVPRSIPTRRSALMKSEELQMLAEEATKVYINIDITRYIRDVVVGIRNHPNIQGGLTARASQDLVTVTKSLATIFRQDYLTPELIAIAAEKVFVHRLYVTGRAEHSALPTNEEEEEEDGSKAGSIIHNRMAADVVAEILRIVYVPV